MPRFLSICPIELQIVEGNFDLPVHANCLDPPPAQIGKQTSQHQRQADGIFFGNLQYDIPNFRRGFAFAQETIHTRLKNLFDEVVVIAGAQYDNRDRHVPGTQLASDLDASHVRHLDVEQQHIGLQFLYKLEGACARAGFTNDTNVRVSFEDFADTAANEVVIIRKDDPDGLLDFHCRYRML